jgi:acetyl esterase/lipase
MRKIVFSLILIPFLLSACAQPSADDNPPRPPHGYPSETLLKTAYVLGMIKLIDTNPAVPEDLAVHRGIIYTVADTIPLRLDIYQKKNLHKAAPTLLFIHGGAWVKGKREDYLPYLIWFAEKEYVTITVSYRLSRTAPFPAAVEDVKCAVRWIKTHARQYGIDPERIALVGGSAGGHLALMAAYSEENEFRGTCSDTATAHVSAVVDLYGPVDLTTPYARNTSEVKGFLRKSWEDNPELYKQASPRYHITSDDPPTLIFQGTLDNLVPVSQSDSLHLWLERAGVANEYHRLKGWPHTMDISRNVFDYCTWYMEAFFRKYM